MLTADDVPRIDIAASAALSRGERSSTTGTVICKKTLFA